MLERIRVNDFAVIRDLELEFSPGLTVFTGETGAGKSLVVDALAFVLGARRGREVIASGAERAHVEALFTAGEAHPVRIERSVGLGGRSMVRIDGESANIDAAAKLGAALADIHGQSGQLAILRPAEQLAVLDEFAGLGAARQQFAAGARELRQVRRRIDALLQDSRERERLVARLEHETGEIAAAALVPGEDTAIRDEASRLGNAGRLLEDAAAILEALEQPGVAEAVRAAQSLNGRDPSANEILDAALLLETAAGDLALAARHYRDTIEEDPGRLEQIQERLDLISRLRRKYGETVDDVIAYGASALEQLRELTGESESFEALERQQELLMAALTTQATELSQARRIAAVRLVGQVSDALADLGMTRARLACGFATDDDEQGLMLALPDYEVYDPGSESEPATGDLAHRAFTDSGVDRFEFLASFNPGEAPRSLGAVASGGETSRFLLALVTVLGAAAPARTIVFDEVDEGVGGRAGSFVGAALARLAERHQVLCVTHLPQVAAFGEHHFAVAKETDGAHTWTRVRTVEGEDRVAELAAMFGSVSDASMAAARELFASARPS